MSLEDDNKEPSGFQLRQRARTEQQQVITNANNILDTMQKSGPVQLPPELYNQPSPAEGFKPSQVMKNSDGTLI